VPRYTPAEIITAGINDTRETFAHLYVVLDELRARAAYEYHHAFVQLDTDPHRAGRLPFHPAPAEFGGDELVLPARKVNLGGLTDAGLQLYTHGARTALKEREQLLLQIDQAGHDLERMHAATDGTTAHLVTSVLRHIDALERRHHAAEQPASRPLTAWADAPVRIPGTTTYLTHSEGSTL
jgi:hypothetical protein